MYFVSDEPRLFNIETGVVVSVSSLGHSDDHYVDIGDDKPSLFEGTRQECEDFIYAMAGWVGAVNPTAKPERDTVLR